MVDVVKADVAKADGLVKKNWEKFKAAPIPVKVVTAGSAIALAAAGTTVLVPVAVVGLGTTAYYKLFKKNPMTAAGYSAAMTEERVKIFQQALEEKDETKILKLANEFEKAGCLLEADYLRKRAALKNLPPETKARNKAVLKKALASTDPVAVAKVAEAFKKVGAAGTAEKLAARVETLKAVG